MTCETLRTSPVPVLARLVRPIVAVMSPGREMAPGREVPLMQWAAVRTWFGDTRVPPQETLKTGPVIASETMKGYSPSSAG